MQKASAGQVPKSPVPCCFWEQLPLTPCPWLCCLQLSLPAAGSLSPRLLPARHSPHPTRWVLSSALQTPPGSRALPRGSSLGARPRDQVTQTLLALHVWWWSFLWAEGQEGDLLGSF